MQGGDQMTSTSDLVSRYDPMPSMDGRWLSMRDIARDLAMSIHTLYKWSARGEPWFPKSIRLHNGELRVRRDWYEEWLTHMEAGR